MMDENYLILFILLGILGLILFFTPRPPPLDLNLYYVGKGVATASNEATAIWKAKNGALADLASQMEVHVKAIYREAIEQHEKGVKVEFTGTVQHILKTTVDLDLKDVKYVTDVERENGNFKARVEACILRSVVESKRELDKKIALCGYLMDKRKIVEAKRVFEEANRIAEENGYEGYLPCVELKNTFEDEYNAFFNQVKKNVALISSGKLKDSLENLKGIGRYDHLFANRLREKIGSLISSCKFAVSGEGEMLFQASFVKPVRVWLSGFDGERFAKELNGLLEGITNLDGRHLPDISLKSVILDGLEMRLKIKGDSEAVFTNSQKTGVFPINNNQILVDNVLDDAFEPSLEVGIDAIEFDERSYPILQSKDIPIRMLLFNKRRSNIIVETNKPREPIPHYANGEMMWVKISNRLPYISVFSLSRKLAGGYEIVTLALNVSREGMSKRGDILRFRCTTGGVGYESIIVISSGSEIPSVSKEMSIKELRLKLNEMKGRWEHDEFIYFSGV